MRLLSTRRRVYFLGTVLLLACLGSTSMADIPRPEIPKAKEMANPATKCVRPVEDMRKHHMQYLLHQRDETLRQGIRTERFQGESLKECIECHNAPDKYGKVARHDEPDHFCNACHRYVAVKIDCFDCHADKPANAVYRNPLADKKLSQQSGFDSEQLLNQLSLDGVAPKGDKQP
ncbi:MAG: hypothetical protein HY080_15750 [Gammaproteobacteria bacterium]|nr:hypothetical protein [Gammaproteobacteria bacterium]